MYIVGLTGAIGHGKTTLSHLLAQNANSCVQMESSDIILEVASQLLLTEPPSDVEEIEAINAWLKPLPQVLAQVVSVQVSFEKIKLAEQRIAASPQNYAKLFKFLRSINPEQTLDKKNLRPLLQWLGGYLVKTVDTGIWYEEIVRRIKLRPNVEIAIVGGLRFPGDAEILHKAGGVVMEIVRPDCKVQDAADITEIERRQIKVDSRVINDGSIVQLKQLAIAILQDLRLDKLKHQYRHAP